MGVQDRDYMRGSVLGTLALGYAPQSVDGGLIGGIEANDADQAQKILHFACPTKLADGLWYRVTVAVSNVPVAELYNVLSVMKQRGLMK